MRPLFAAALVSGGILSGIAISAAAALYAEGLDATHGSASAVQNLSTKELAKVFLDKVASSLIADTRSSSNTADGVGFFGTPKPYGRSLCRIERFWFPTKVVQNYRNARDYWKDDLVATDVYGIWTNPGTYADWATRRNDACSSYRDFAHVIEGNDGGAIERSINLLSTSQAELQHSSQALPVTCIDEREYPATNCDGANLLRHLDLKQIRRISSVSTIDSGSKVQRVDEVDMAPVSVADCGAAATTLQTYVVKISSSQLLGQQDDTEGSVDRIDIVRQKFC